MISLLTGINSTAAALDAERTRMDVIEQNISNANSTHGPDGKPYQRQQVVFESVLRAAQGDAPGEQSVRIARIKKDTRPARQVYMPGNPDANSQGMVSMPDINIHEEMVDMIESSRSYEANLAVVKNAHTLALQALSIGKHA